MRNLINDQKAKPAPKNRVSVLFIVFVAVILAIIGVTSWSYFDKPAQPEAPLATASTEISPTVEVSTESAEVLHEPEPSEPQTKVNNTAEPSPMGEEAMPPKLTATPEPESSAPPENPEATQEKQQQTIEDVPASNELMHEPPKSLSMTPEAQGQKNPEVLPDPFPESTAPAKTEQENAPPVFEELPTSAAPVERPEDTLVTEEPTKEPPPAIAAETDTEGTVEPDGNPEKIRSRDTPVEKQPQATVIVPRKDAVTEEPVIEDILPPFQEFSAPFNSSDERPRIAIVVSDAGMNAARTREAIENLPAPVTLAFNPYGDNLQKFVDRARQAGHEVLLQLPMEPKGYPGIDPGPQALRTDLDEAENLRRLYWTLERITGYVGLTNQMGSKFTAEAASITPVLLVMKEKGLLYLDSRTASDSVSADIAIELGIPVAINNRFLDHKADGDIIDSRLEELENIARQSGSSVGIAYPHEETFQHLLDWTNTLDKKGFVLAPVSALIDNRKTND